MSTNITSIREANSRYQRGGSTDQYSKRLGWWDRTIFAKDSSDIIYTIEPKYEYRPDLLAYDMYKNESLGWFILQYNNILDINTEFKTGNIIMLPTTSRLKLYLL